MAAADGPTMSRVATRLSDKLGGVAENVVLLDAVDSTHAFAIRLMEQVDDESVRLPTTVIVARRQTRGVGRGRRSWASPEGGLYANWIGTGLDPAVIGRLPILAAAAARSALQRLGLTGVGIKWPNDVIVHDRKLAGLLVHAHHGAPTWATVGLGVNLAIAPRLDDRALLAATSVADHLGPAPWEDRALTVVCEFVAALARSIVDPEPALEDWLSSLVHREGDPLRVRLATGETVCGSFDGVTEDGFLRLGMDGEERIISSGDVIEQS
jgi:BirA family biotin operon repressor/biotin-[acetyl-CoA-carboxylase] ligase